MEGTWQRLPPSPVRTSGGGAYDGSTPELTRAILEGTGPFSPSQCHRLLGNARASLGLEKRLEALEAALGETRRGKDECEHLVAQLGDQVDKLQRRGDEERKTREAQHATVAERLAAEALARDEHRAAFGERLERTERHVADSLEAQRKHFEASARRLGDVDEAQKEQLATALRRLDDVEAKARAGSADWQELRGNTLERMAQFEQVLASARTQLTELRAGQEALQDERASQQAQQAGLQDRFGRLERSVAELAGGQAQDLAEARARLEEMQGRWAQDAQLREAAGRGAAALERVADLEEALRAWDERHTKDVAAMKSAHAALIAKEAQAREVHHATWEERVRSVETLFGDSADRHAHDLALAHNKVDKLHALVTSEQREASAKHTSFSSQFAKERDARDALHELCGSMKQRLDCLEGVLGDGHERTARELAVAHDKVDQLRARLAEEQKAKEAHYGSIHEQLAKEKETRDVHVASTAERLAYMERVLTDTADRHANETGLLHQKVDQLRGHTEGMVDHAPTIESLKQAHHAAASERASMHGQHAALAERLDHLEGRHHGAAEQHGQEITVAHARLEQLHSRLAEVGAARDTQHAATLGQLAREQQARETLHATTQERLKQLQDLLADVSSKQDQDLRTQQVELQGRLSLLEQKVGGEVTALREMFVGERQLQGQHQDDLVEHLGNERRARDALERAVHQHLAQERESRELHECTVHEQLGLEQASRDRHHEHVQELFSRERELRERGLATCREQLEMERSARETCLREVQLALSKERDARDQQHTAWQEALREEQAERRAVEERCSQQVVAREKAEQGRPPTGILQGIESIQSQLMLVDSLIRTEAEQRAVEVRQLWRAVDNHTHDLTTQMVEFPEDRPGQPAVAGRAATAAAAGGGGGVLASRLPAGQASASAAAAAAAAAQEPQRFAWEVPGRPASLQAPPPGAAFTGGLVGGAAPGARALAPMLGPPPVALAAPAPAVSAQAVLGAAHSAAAPAAVKPAMPPHGPFGAAVLPAAHAAAEPTAAAGRECRVELIACGNARYGGRPNRLTDGLYH